MTDNRLELSRRKVLAGLGATGLASAGAGLGTSAYLSDRESFGDNSISAGELDLKMDWQQSYYDGLTEGQVRDDHTTWKQVNAYPDTDGDGDQDTILTRDEIAGKDEYESGDLYEELNEEDRAAAEQAFRDQFADLPTDFEEPVIDLSDVKPGDEGEITISMHLFDNLGHIWMASSGVESNENDIIEPEEGAEGEDGTDEGELMEAIEAELWRDTDCDNVRDTGNPCVQLVVDNTDSMGNRIDGSDTSSDSKDLAVVDELETLIQSYDGDDDDTLNDAKFGLTLWGGDPQTLNPADQSFGEFVPEGGDPAASFTPQTDDEAALLGDTTTGDEEGSDPSDPNGIQNVLDQNATTGDANIGAGVDEGAHALAKCPEDEQRIMVLVTNGVTLNTSGFTSTLQSNLRVNGGSVDKYVVVGLQVDGSSKTVLSAVESLSGHHEFINAFSRSEFTMAFNGSPPFSGGVDSSVKYEIDSASGSSQEPLIATGSLGDVLDEIAAEDGGVMLDGQPGMEGTNCFEASTTNCIALHWWLPATVGNKVQSDSAEFTLDFYAEQCRHNAEPSSPFPMEEPTET